MMCRRPWLIAVMLAMLAGVWLRSAEGASRLSVDEMKAALRTTTIEEEGFVAKVVALVDAGKLPRDMVDSTFQWARRKSRLRFQYFKRGLIVRAAEIGVKL